MDNVKKTDIIDEELKSGLNDLLDITLNLKHIVVKEIQTQQEILKNFETNQNEYIETISDFETFEQERFERELAEYQAALKKVSEGLKG